MNTWTTPPTGKLKPIWNSSDGINSRWKINGLSIIEWPDPNQEIQLVDCCNSPEIRATCRKSPFSLTVSMA